jgi:CRP-like cAMP-binding protein
MSASPPSPAPKNHLSEQMKPLSEATQKAVFQVLQYQFYPKGSIVLTPGKIAECLYFVEKGLMRSYYFEEEDEREPREITAWIVAEGGVAMATESFYRQIPSAEYLEVLEDSTVFTLSREDFLELQRRYADFARFVLQFTEQYLLIYDARTQLLRMRSPLNRYLAFDRQYPFLRGRLSQSILASYLNMSYYQISRIRTQIARGTR